ncbi:MAG: 50S ribosomal protein L10 [Deltaproteobacteria bacterium]|nr:50S ribosomal protein L10 [Deltaproteobacteria bacterium]
MNRQEKEEVVKELHESFSDMKTAILTDFRGLNVDAMNDLRKLLKAESVEYRVIKNTLLGLSAQDTDMALMKDYFVGPCAVALSKEDPVAPAKVLVRFAEKNSALEIKAGVLNGNVLDVHSIKALADLPSREVLLAQLLSAMNGVSTGLVVALSGVARNLLGVLTALKDQKEKTD